MCWLNRKGSTIDQEELGGNSPQLLTATPRPQAPTLQKKKGVSNFARICLAKTHLAQKNASLIVLSLVFEEHVVFWGQTDTCSQNIFQHCPLLTEGIDHWRPFGY